VDTSVWSLALRRDSPPGSPEVLRLGQALETGETVLSTGLVLQELLQGFYGPTDVDAILLRFAHVPLLSPDRRDHIEAAALRSRCRRAGIQVATVDALLAQLCVHHDLPLLTTDKDFIHIATVTPLRVWT